MNFIFKSVVKTLKELAKYVIAFWALPLFCYKKCTKVDKVIVAILWISTVSTFIHGAVFAGIIQIIAAYCITFLGGFFDVKITEAPEFKIVLTFSVVENEYFDWCEKIFETTHINNEK